MTTLALAPRLMPLLSVLLAAALLAGCTAKPSFVFSDEPPTLARLSVAAEVVGGVDERIFGQFLERPSWGETGPEGVLNDQGELPAEVVDRLAAMDIPLIRFPGGTDIDYIDWTDMISRAPTREAPERPLTTGHTGQEVSNRFGYDEYFALAEQLGWETILVVNFLDGLSGAKPLDEAALHAAGLLAYCNAAVGEPLPPGMPDWPAVRAANGRVEPWRARYVQIGNECFLGSFRKRAWAAEAIAAADGAIEAKIAWYAEALLAYAAALKAVDPEVQIIFDARLGQRELSRGVLSDPRVREVVDYATFHSYGPMGVGPMEWDGIDEGEQRGRLVFGALSALPAAHAEGPHVANPDDLAFFGELGYEVSVTEWNWNGWGLSHLGEHQSVAGLASALGSAQYVHGMIADGVALATQSMLVGHGWNIAAVHVDPTGERPTFMSPQALATDLYRHHHGPEILRSELTDGGSYGQPLPARFLRQREGLPLIDALATRDANGGDRLFIHLINHDLTRARRVAVSLEGLHADGAGEGRCWTIDGDVTTTEWSRSAWTDSRPIIVAGNEFTLDLPPHTVNIFEIPLK